MAVLLDPVFQATLHLCFALLFGWSAWHKLVDLRGFVSALQGYGLLPARSLRTTAVTLALLEGSVCCLLLGPRTGSGAALVGAALLAGYGFAMASAWLRGRRDIDCGCGAAGMTRAIGPDLMARNGLLAMLLTLAALPADSRPYGWLDGFTLVIAVAAFTLLFVAAERALMQRRALEDWRNSWRSHA